jgi:hypothetical protein
LLPSEKTLVGELIPELAKLGASDTDLAELKLEYLRDTLTKPLEVSFLTENDQRKVLAYTLDLLRSILFPKKVDDQGLPKPSRKYKIIDE